MSLPKIDFPVALRALLGRRGFETDRDGVTMQCFNTASHARGDERPSLDVSLVKAGFVCRSCGVKGGAVALVRGLDGCDERAAMATLAAAAGSSSSGSLPASRAPRPAVPSVDLETVMRSTAGNWGRTTNAVGPLEWLKEHWHVGEETLDLYGVGFGETRIKSDEGPWCSTFELFCPSYVGNALVGIKKYRPEARSFAPTRKCASVKGSRHGLFGAPLLGSATRKTLLVTGGEKDTLIVAAACPSLVVVAGAGGENAWAGRGADAVARDLVSAKPARIVVALDVNEKDRGQAAAVAALLKAGAKNVHAIEWPADFSREQPKGGSAQYVLAHGGDAFAALVEHAPTVSSKSTQNDENEIQTTDLPTIDTGPDIGRMVDEAERALVEGNVDVYSRGGELVRLVDRHDRLSVDALPHASLAETLSREILWRGKNRTGEVVRVRPPRDVVEALAARGTWTLREVVDVVERPCLRPDGTVLDVAGYDPSSRIYFRPSVAFPRVSSTPVFGQALHALGELREVFCDFPFATNADRTVALSLVLTLLGRHAIHGPAPLFAIRAHERGEGKSLIVDAASVIATGAEAPRTTQATSSEDERKELLSFGREGTPFVLIDNVERPLGSAELAAALTARTYRGRLLGSSKTLTVAVPVYAATGCNLEVRGDLGRRTLPCDLASNVERPEERSGFKHPELLAWIRAERPRLVAAGLTVLRWFFHEGRPSVPLKAFGSFEAWSAIVRAVLVWLGEPDPIETRERFRKEGDPALEALGRLLEVWTRLLGSGAHTVAELVSVAGRETELRDALAALDAKLDPDRLDGRRLGYAFRRVRGRFVDGRRLERVDQGNRDHTTLWRVEVREMREIDGRSSEASPAPEARQEGGSQSETGDAGDDSQPLARTRARAHAREETGNGLAGSPASPASPARPPSGFVLDPDTETPGDVG